jgi:hypothetical protein
MLYRPWRRPDRLATAVGLLIAPSAGAQGPVGPAVEPAPSLRRWSPPSGPGRVGRGRHASAVPAAGADHRLRPARGRRRRSDGRCCRQCAGLQETIVPRHRGGPGRGRRRCTSATRPAPALAVLFLLFVAVVAGPLARVVCWWPWRSRPSPARSAVAHLSGTDPILPSSAPCHHPGHLPPVTASTARPAAVVGTLLSLSKRYPVSVNAGHLGYLGEPPCRPSCPAPSTSVACYSPASSSAHRASGRHHHLPGRHRVPVAPGHWYQRPQVYLRAMDIGTARLPANTSSCLCQPARPCCCCSFTAMPLGRVVNYEIVAGDRPHPVASIDRLAVPLPRASPCLLTRDDADPRNRPLRSGPEGRLVKWSDLMLR